MNNEQKLHHILKILGKLKPEFRWPYTSINKMQISFW